MEPHIVPWSKDRAIEDEKRWRFAIEADNNTEPPAVIRGKALAYRAVDSDDGWFDWWYAQYGPPPIPVWVAPTQARCEVIRRQWERAWPEGTWQITDDEGLKRNRWLLWVKGKPSKVRLVFVPDSELQAATLPAPTPAALPTPTTPPAQATTATAAPAALPAPAAQPPQAAPAAHPPSAAAQPAQTTAPPRPAPAPTPTPTPAPVTQPHQAAARRAMIQELVPAGGWPTVQYLPPAPPVPIADRLQTWWNQNFVPLLIIIGLALVTVQIVRSADVCGFAQVKPGATLATTPPEDDLPAPVSLQAGEWLILSCDQPHQVGLEIWRSARRLPELLSFRYGQEGWVLEHDLDIEDR